MVQMKINVLRWGKKYSSYLAGILLVILLILVVLVVWPRASGTPRGRANRLPIAIASMMRNPVDLPLWLKYHRNLGISRFFIRLEDSPSWEEYLQTAPDVVVEIGTSDDSGNNYSTVIDRQIVFVNKVLRDNAAAEDIDWIIHIDSDELLHGDLTAVSSLPPTAKTVKFINAEAIFEEPKKRDTCFTAKKFLRCDQGAPCKSYVNGKGGGRTRDPHVFMAGPHDFGYRGTETAETNYKVPFEQLHVLHFEGCTFSGWVDKYYHMSKNDRGDMPFPYYKESIQAAKRAHELYKENKMPDPTQFNAGQVYNLNSPIKI